MTTHRPRRPGTVEVVTFDTTPLEQPWGTA